MPFASLAPLLNTSLLPTGVAPADCLCQSGTAHCALGAQVMNMRVLAEGLCIGQVLLGQGQAVHGRVGSCRLYVMAKHDSG